MTLAPDAPNIADLLGARAYIDNTIASIALQDKLRHLGFTKGSRAEFDVCNIMLRDYPNKPMHWFGTDALAETVGRVMYMTAGGCGTRRSTVATYFLAMPPGLGEDVEYAYDLMPHLDMLTRAAQQFNVTHGGDYPLDQIIQLHYAYNGDIEKILPALMAGVNGKQAMDMLKLGYTHAEILQIHHIPIGLIFDGAPSRAALHGTSDEG